MASFKAPTSQHAALHQLAASIKPDDELTSNKYWVGIIRHNEQEPLTESTPLLWVKAKPSTKASKLINAYNSSAGTAGVSPLLLFDTRIIDEGVQVQDLNIFHDNVVLLQAVLPASPRAVAARAFPLIVATSPSSRSPLKEVSRQISMTPTSDIETIAKPPATFTLPSESLADRSALPYSHATLKTDSSFSDSCQQPPSFDQYPTARIQLSFVKSEPLEGLDGTAEAPQTSQAAVVEEHSVLPEFEPNEGDELIPDDTQEYFEEAEQETSHGTDGPFQPTSLQQLMKQASPELLESGVQTGLHILATIQQCLDGYTDDLQDRDRFKTHIESIKQQARRTRTVVGVVGNTGAGKSSVINAVLEEERLLPTNCMRACTAVVTEVSWNDDHNEDKKYRAEIEFIKAEDWRKELKTLFEDLLNENGEISRDAQRNSDTDAGIAYAKIKAVYPDVTKETISRIKPDTLLNDVRVTKLLGKTHEVYNSSPSLFYDSLQKYVDSKEKSTDEKKNKKERRQMEYWPLIKVVRIYVKSDALATGAVIVDLPGVHDSNAARAAVAEGYLRQCTRLWIVAPINRAVDDKAAKKLLGDQFKRQLKYDGTYNSVTFICSKTDDINITEASEVVDATAQINEWWDEIDKLEAAKRELAANERDLKESRATYADVFSEQDELVDRWEDLLEKAEAGENVYTSKKRKRAPETHTPKKRPNLSHSESGFTDSSDESDVAIDASQEEEQPSGPLTIDAIKTNLAEAKESKAEARKQKLALGPQIDGLRKQIKEIDEKIEELQSDIAAQCILGRNQYSKGAIQQDFAAGIKELDQENAIEQDEENFNPDEDLRDYDEVARSLPVYCVSSKAYQKMCGRMKKDAMPSGFKTKNETEIPQLKDHCRQLTEASRVSNCRGFLNNLNQLLNSLIIWSSNDSSGIKLTDAEHQAESNWLNKKLTELERHFDTAVCEGVHDIKNTLADNLLQYYPATIKEAEQAAVPAAESWGKPTKAGGLFWGTYKAVCRRNGGPFAGSGGGIHDFNKTLVEPIEKLLASRWELTFQRRIPKVLKHITTRLNRMLSQFHKLVEKRVLQRGVGGVPGLHFLSQHVDSSHRTFDTLVGRLFAIVSEKQKEANRELVPVISEAMADGYGRCVDERGAGSYLRMKGHMLKHVQERKDSMFEEAIDSVKDHLRKMRAEVEEQMREETELVFQAMRSEYFAVIVGTKLPEGYVMPRDERKLRRDIGDLVKEADEHFERVMNDEAGLENMAEGSEKRPSEEPKAKPEDDVMKDVEDGEEAANPANPWSIQSFLSILR